MEAVEGFTAAVVSAVAATTRNNHVEMRDQEEWSRLSGT
jgi:hypothetical protein